MVKRVGTYRNDAEHKMLKGIAFVDRSGLIKPGQFSLDLEHRSSGGIFLQDMTSLHQEDSSALVAAV